MKPTILCIAAYEKGFDFMRECKAQGWQVILLTGESLRHSNWPMEAIDNVFYMPDPDKQWDLQHMLKAAAYLARSIEITKVSALDDFDVEKAAMIREHLRIEGMGDTTARNFRDKLSMRGRALDAGIPVPRFVGIINYDRIKRFLSETVPPYVLKPRFQANAIGIEKIERKDELWIHLDRLGDSQTEFLLEEFIPGQIAHVDSITVDGEVIFAAASMYGTPPMEVFHGGRVFTTRTLKKSDTLTKKLVAMNQDVMTAMGLRIGVSHTEFIVHDGKPYFLETSARVGGAHIADMVEAAYGLNLWREWAKLEMLLPGQEYKLPKLKNDHAVLLNTLAQQEWPDMSSYNDPEVVWRMKKRQHAGLIAASKDYERITELQEQYVQRFYKDFFASLPAAVKASQLA